VKKTHPLVHQDYRGLISLVNPRIFENCITHAVKTLGLQLGFELIPNKMNIVRCLNDFQTMIEDAQDEDFTPEPPDLIDLYADFCRLVSKNSFVSRTEDAGSCVIDINKGAMKNNISNIFAVSLTLGLFQDEFIVDYNECHISQNVVFVLARRIKDTKNFNIFSVHELKSCRYLPQNTY
jgi:hypothetical protein